jgi:hypothetical protein
LRVEVGVMSFRGRFAAVAGVFVLATASLIASAEVASAMPTHRCSQKGTSGADTIDVSVPMGHASAASPWVVCAGHGDDTIVVRDVTSFGPAYLYIAMGDGQKTVDWSAGNIAWGADQGQIPGGGIIVRPASNPDIIMTGDDSAFPGAWFDCGTNDQYKAAASQWEMHIATGYTELYWRASERMNYNHC